MRDIVGLTVQALTNSPARAKTEWHDVRLLVRAAWDAKRGLDWELTEDYLRIFELEAELEMLRRIRGAAESRRETRIVDAVGVRAVHEQSYSPGDGEPARPPLSTRDYMRLATVASRFNRGIKPVAPAGPHWKL